MEPATPLPDAQANPSPDALTDSPDSAMAQTAPVAGQASTVDPSVPLINATTRAKISPGYTWRLALIGVMCLAFGGWFLYDGMVTYPRQMSAYQAFEAFTESTPDWRSNPQVWQDYAAKNNLNPNIDAIQKHSDRDQNDIYTQFIMAALVTPVGLFFGFSFLRSLSRYIEADPQGLRTNGNKHIAWEDITAIESERWAAKGIAVVKGTSSQGDVAITLDDWKFDREPTSLIYSEALRHMDPQAYLQERAAAAARAAARDEFTPPELDEPTADQPDHLDAVPEPDRPLG